MTARRFLILAIVCLLGWAAAGCGSETGSTGGDPDSGVSDVTDEPDADDDGGDLGTLDDAGTPDATPDVDQGGELGDECDDDDECVSEYCADVVAGEGGGVCTRRCSDNADCPSGFDCIFIATSGGDAEQICLQLDLCFDRDMDGFGVGPGCDGPDCDDDNPNASPRTNEICDSIDNDCDGDIDDFPTDANVPCETGFEGPCAEGRFACQAGILVCEGQTPVGEMCDGVDNDCDGPVDEGLAEQPFYRDADADGFGDPDGESMMACARPTGYVENRTDCDDSNENAFPGAPETPGDGIDNDCNNTELCFADRDRDGARTEELVETTSLDCSADQVTGAEAAIDCDDGDADAYPGAMEIVGDEVDQDCDGMDGCYADADGDGYRTDMTVGSDNLSCEDEGEATADDPDGDCNDSEATAFPGNPEICDLIDNDCNDRVDDGAGCYPVGDECLDDADCITGACLDGLCADTTGCTIPGRCPDRGGNASGVGRRDSESWRLDVVIGAPVGVQSTSSENYRMSIGLGAYTTNP